MTDCSPNIDDLQFDIPVTVVTIKGGCECGSVLTYDCDGTATCVDDCDLEKRLEACRECTDLFDLCCMPECEDGKYLRINSCADCTDKYELVDACEIWTEIVNNDKCGFEVDIQCETLEPLFEVCSALKGNDWHDDWSIQCVGGKMQICGSIPEPFSCDQLFNCFPEDIVTCEQTCEEIIAEVSDCPPCEDCDEPECEYRQLMYCPEEKTLKLEENLHKIKCYRNSRGKAKLNGGLNIQMTAGDERAFYLSPIEVEATRGSIEWIGDANVLVQGKDLVDTNWEHIVRNAAVGANGIHEVCTAGDYQISFNFQVEINKTIHALRMGLAVVKKDGTVTVPTQNKLGGVDGFYYNSPCPAAQELLCAHGGRSCDAVYGQPNTPDLFYGPWGCNDYTSAFGGQSNATNDTQGGGRDGSTFSLGRVVEATTLGGSTREFLEPGDRVIPVVFVSAAMNGDCDAKNNTYQAIVSILGEGLTTGGGASYPFTSTYEVVKLNDIEENKCLLEKYGCSCGGLEGTDVETCCCDAQTITSPTQNFIIGEAAYIDYVEPEPDCDINGPEDCPAGTVYYNLGDCGVCVNEGDGLPGTGGSV